MKKHAFIVPFILLPMLLINACKDKTTTTPTINKPSTVSNVPIIHEQMEKDSSVLLIFHNGSKYNIAQVTASTLYKSYKLPKKKHQEKTLYGLPIGATDSLRLDFFNPNIYGISASFVVGKDTLKLFGGGSDMYTEGHILRHAIVTYNLVYNRQDSIMYTNRKIIK